MRDTGDIGGTRKEQDGVGGVGGGGGPRSRRQRRPKKPFRFHPTDEELVGFYLKRKIQQKSPLNSSGNWTSASLIHGISTSRGRSSKSISPLSSSGKWTSASLIHGISQSLQVPGREWYFHCPRDRKYRSNVRPNRVTAAGLWKATGTDRPIYSSEGTKCIGLKEFLVFYKGRAAREIKTDCMMHEFRLPSLNDPLLLKRPIDKNIPLNDSWTIYRIFKKTSSMAQRALSHTWGPPLPGTTEPDIFCALQSVQASQFALESSSCSLQAAAPTSQSTSKYGLQGQQQQFQKPNNTQDGSSCKVINFNCNPPVEVQNGPIILPFEAQASQKATDAAPLFFDAQFGQPELINGFVVDSSANVNGGISNRNQDSSTRKPGNCFSVNNDWEALGRINFPFDL